jgi:lipopolysaccharide/colanic/teichoic acid biosynthesis glycosyltransferase
MSLVGPWPRYSQNLQTTLDAKKTILTIKPGMVGLWQVSRSPSSEVIRYDLEYINKWSLFLDIKILLRTMFVILFSK